MIDGIWRSGFFRLIKLRKRFWLPGWVFAVPNKFQGFTPVESQLSIDEGLFLLPGVEIAVMDGRRIIFCRLFGSARAGKGIGS